MAWNISKPLETQEIHESIRLKNLRLLPEGLVGRLIDSFIAKE